MSELLAWGLLGAVLVAVGLLLVLVFIGGLVKLFLPWASNICKKPLEKKHQKHVEAQNRRKQQGIHLRGSALRIYGEQAEKRGKVAAAAELAR